MKVKRYLALDMRRALAQIREEMGEEAVILSNRSLEGGVEVVAASLPGDISFSSSGKLEKSDIDKVDHSAVHATESSQSSPLQESLTVAGIAESMAAKAAADATTEMNRLQRERAVTESQEMNRMRSELNGIRRLLEQRLSGIAWDQFVRRTPVQASLWERLNAMGIPAALNKTLLESIKPEYTAAQAWRFAIATLSRRVPLIGTDIAAHGGIIALLGPTGVGKTTTIGKLATRYVLEHGPDSVALVTTDSFRVAAHEQLRTFGRILGIPVRVVDQGHSLQQVLNSLRHKSLVLVDTAGLHASDPALQTQLQSLRECQEVKNLLVLACTSQATVLHNAWKTYAPVGLSGCVLSKLDEAGMIGEALALIIERQLAVAYETHGQHIPDDIGVAQAHKLVSKAVALSIHSEAENERLIHEFGNVFGDEIAPFEQPRVTGRAQGRLG